MSYLDEVARAERLIAAHEAELERTRPPMLFDGIEPSTPTARPPLPRGKCHICGWNKLETTP